MLQSLRRRCFGAPRCVVSDFECPRRWRWRERGLRGRGDLRRAGERLAGAGGGPLGQSWDNIGNTWKHLEHASHNAYYSATSPQVMGDQCTWKWAVELQPVTFGAQIVACTIRSGAECENGGVCMDPSIDGRICIVSQGDVDCPAGTYTHRVLFHEGADDQRQCEECSCGLHAKCSGSVHLYSACKDHEGKLLGEIGFGECTEEEKIHNQIKCAKVVGEVEGTCTPSGGGIGGQVEKLGAWTFCCR